MFRQIVEGLGQNYERKGRLTKQADGLHLTAMDRTLPVHPESIDAIRGMEPEDSIEVVAHREGFEGRPHWVVLASYDPRRERHYINMRWAHAAYSP
ncbi:MAG: hypothetical protein ABH879_05885 [archaeon]